MIKEDLKPMLRRIVDISYRLQLGHLGSCITALPIIEEIYATKKPDEKFVLSSGHAHLAHLVIMENELRKTETVKWDEGVRNYREDGMPAWDAEAAIKAYGIHCDRKAGCDVSTGSLGHGIGIAVGMALVEMDNFLSQIQDSCPTRECEHQRMKNVYCLLSDGECNEGSAWEAMRIRHELGLTNLKVYLNNNGWAAYAEGGAPRWPDSFEYELRETNMNDYPKWLQGQIAHYKVLDKKEYKELMEILK